MEESVNWLKVTYDETDNNKLKDLYIGWSQVYDEEMVDGGYAYNEYVEELIPKYSPDKTSRVLELACGSGYVGKSIHQIGYSNLHGVDYSPDMLAQAEKKGIYQSLVQTNLKQPMDMIDSDSIDTVMCVGFFCRGHMDAKILDEVFRILKPDGHLVCSIGENIIEVMGFKDKIKQLVNDNVIQIEETTEPFVVMPENEASANSRMWVIRKR